MLNNVGDRMQLISRGRLKSCKTSDGMVTFRSLRPPGTGSIVFSRVECFRSSGVTHISTPTQTRSVLSYLDLENAETKKSLIEPSHEIVHIPPQKDIYHNNQIRIKDARSNDLPKTQAIRSKKLP